MPLTNNRQLATNHIPSHQHRLVAFDLDDTLLLPSGDISARSRAALEDTYRAGIQVVLASGRMLTTILPIVETLSFQPPLVSFNGAQVNLRADEPPWFHRPVPAPLAEEIIDFALRHQLHLNFYFDNRLFTTSIDDWEARIYRAQTGAHLEYEPNFDNLRGFAPTKLIIIEEPPRVESLMYEWQERVQGQLTVTRSKPIYLEFLHRDVNKGASFVELCRHLEVPLEQTAAFGDSYNDIEMLQAAGTAIVVDNGLPEAKAVADSICPANEEDGVAQILEAWNEIRENEKRESIARSNER